MEEVILLSGLAMVLGSALWVGFKVWLAFTLVGWGMIKLGQCMSNGNQRG